MKKYILAIMLLTCSLTSELSAGVNIAEVSGKYQEPTKQDAIEHCKILSMKLMTMAMQAAYKAGYAQAEEDYGIVESTGTKK